MQGYTLESDKERFRLSAENEARARFENFDYRSMSADQQHIFNRELMALDQDWQAEVRGLDYDQAEKMLGLSHKNDLAIVSHRRKENELFREFTDPRDLKMLKERYGLEEHMQAKGARYTWQMNDRLARNARGHRSKEAATAFKRMTAFQADQAGKGHEYRLAEMQFASDLEIASRLPAREQDRALREIYEGIRDNDQLPNAQRLDAEKLLALGPAQLQQAVMQERQIAASLYSNYAAMDERWRVTEEGREYDQYRYGSRLGEKRQYKEGGSTAQVRDRWNKMQMGMGDKEFRDAQMRQDWIEGEIQRRLRSGQGASIPGLPPGR